MRPWAVVVLAAGQTSGMKSRLPTSLHPVCGSPMVKHVVLAAGQVASSLPLLVVPAADEAFRAALGEAVQYVAAPDAGDVAGALARVRFALGEAAEHLLVLPGDAPLITAQTIEALLREHEETDADLSHLVAHSVAEQGGGVGLGQGTTTAPSPSVALADVFAVQGRALWPSLERLGSNAPSGRPFLTRLAGLLGAGGLVRALPVADPVELVSVQDRVSLARAEQVMQDRIRQRLMLAGVTLLEPASTFVDAEVQVGLDTVLYPNTHLYGATRVGADCRVGPNAIVKDSVVGDGCIIFASVVEGATLERHVDVGPFSHLRTGTYLEEEVHIGNYAEVKNSRLGRGTKMGHSSYVGDADVGPDVNIGAGTITCNFDGQQKHRTIIGAHSFIGSDTMLVAPITLGEGARTGAGAVVTKDVPPGSVVVGMPARPVPPGKR
ncbi:MAG: bifunctional N-acetylglucosamine-1-phosphate uridyltransferase/glucosamine-1-phosphate acetyltransferase [Chloroflexi bacterium]|nr:bifunctional N-acetylglucosamine-1-phosphate uridyltransferase/glucosamine-1-phosphate acetyltransferase [Chloroflexota bacterium]